MTTPPHRFRSQAWLLSGITGSSAGRLEYADGHLTYVSDEGTVFDVEVGELTEVRFPWYYFSGGVKFTLGREHYRLSFIRPNGAGGDIFDVGEARRAGKIWKSILLRRPQDG